MSESKRVLKYLWLRDKKKRPIACVAYTAAKNSTRIELGFSVCNKVDEPQKILGRNLARQRMESKPMVFDSSGKTALDLRIDVLKFLANTKEKLDGKDIPTFVRRYCLQATEIT